jgi:hypothetical protein
VDRLIKLTPTLITLIAVGGIWLYGPIVQFAHYHEFADDRSVFGIANAWNVLSNIGFAGVWVWGLWRLWGHRTDPILSSGWPGYSVFLYSLILTTAGSSFYHWSPDNFRLIWDRLPIALACAGLLTAVSAETNPQVNGSYRRIWLMSVAVFGVFWWYYTGENGQGDLRPYLLLQCLPLVLIPLWQAIYGATRSDRLVFGLAIGLYAVAKAAEWYDHGLLVLLGGWISGHTIKHLLAAAASAVIVARLVDRVKIDTKKRESSLVKTTI